MKPEIHAPTCKPMLRVLDGQTTASPPVWLMRQAGRYLPEYRQLRAQAKSFMDFCFTPTMASEATLQPIRRFGFDASIIFSDILVIPHALGQTVTFETGKGPQLQPIETPDQLTRLNEMVDFAILEPVFETVDRVRSALPKDCTLIGFCGAPWTVATYMIAGHGTPDQAPARMFAYNHPEDFRELIDLLVEASVLYLRRQADAGVEVVQIFDSWAGVLPDQEFQKWCFEPLKRISESLKASHPAVKIIAFDRAAPTYLEAVAALPSIDAVGLDTSVCLDWSARNIQKIKPVQGNLDPLALVSGGAALDRSIDLIVEKLKGGPHIFNLGHGILPHTPVEHVAQLIRRVRSLP